MPDEEKATGDQQEANATPEPVEETIVPPSSPADHVSGERTNPPENEKHPTEHDFRKWSLRFSALLVIIGAAYSFFAAKQWQTMRGQLTQMKKSTDIAASNYRLQTKALHIDQRAWVAPETITGKAELDKPYAITVTIKNTGKTFAKNYTGFAMWVSKQIADPDPDFDAIIAKQANGTESVGLLAPNGGLTVSFEVPEGGPKITDDVIAQFKNPTIVFFVFGKLTYWDIFKCQHWTNFCYRAHPADGTYNVYSAYNGDDENDCQ